MMRKSQYCRSGVQTEVCIPLIDQIDAVADCQLDILHVGETFQRQQLFGKVLRRKAKRALSLEQADFRDFGGWLGAGLTRKT